MKMQPGVSPSMASPPIAKFDPRSPFAQAFVVALACWPKNERRRGHALATWTAQINAVNEALIPGLTEQAIHKGASIAAVKLGISPEELLELPHVKEIVGQTRQLTNEVETMVRNQLFRPAGGWLSMANAAYQGGAGIEFERARKGGHLAGRVLLYCARLERHHQDIETRGWNRAMHIIGGLHAVGIESTISDRDRKEAWAEWRGVSPLWAAMCLSLEMFGDDGLTGPKLIQTLAWAQWFRFGVTHASQSGRPQYLERRQRYSRKRNEPKEPRYLLPESEAVVLKVGVSAQEPPLKALTEPEISIARRFGKYAD